MRTMVAEGGGGGSSNEFMTVFTSVPFFSEDEICVSPKQCPLSVSASIFQSSSLVCVFLEKVVLLLFFSFF